MVRLSSFLRCWCLVGLVCGSFLKPSVAVAKEPVDFNRDIRPIFSEHCFQCHGPDQNTREAELRLDEKTDLYANRDGHRLVTPGDPAKSELISRINATDPSEQMPPADSGAKLTAKQKDLIKRWVVEGAKWKGHWSYVRPTRPEVPQLPGQKNASPIDAFIRAQLAARKLAPSPKADRVTLIRRLYFDLTGLPPTWAKVWTFVNDSDPQAYEKLVDRLLGSTEMNHPEGSIHFGERMAMYWLDLVRYADTNGIHGDNHRNVALYRDYVIQSFHENKPFNQFTREQLAGDLLESPTEETRIASGYNRMLMTTREGGAQAKEYLAKYAADRVRNVSTVWMGATLGCAECHDHKFDPYLTKDFYRFEAFFADLKETAVGTQPPTPFPSSQQLQRQKELGQELAQLKAELTKKTPKVAVAQKAKPVKVEDILRAYTPHLNPLRKKIAQAEQEQKQLNAAIPTTLVSMQVKPRMIRVLPRGNWLDDSGQVVSPAVPEFLPGLKTGDRRANRRDLAEWLVREDNPLTARVFVNRLWKLFHGRGLVTTLDDFGSQGAWPTHPRLLDWLAVEFVESGWNVKHLIRLMVTSETYGQSSRVTPELKQTDPFNQWLARQSRFRLDAEMIRDNALAVSGLLDETIKGPSVKPYQPSGYWKHLNFPKRKWQANGANGQYRRGLYTYWCRTFLHPSLLAFDAPTREECTVERPRSNTPLQALVLLNDPTYVESARALAERILTEGGDTDKARLDFAFQVVLSRSPRESEQRLLLQLLEKHHREYQADRASVEQLNKVGLKTLSANLNPAEHAAWTSIARVLLNLHETLMRS